MQLLSLQCLAATVEVMPLAPKNLITAYFFTEYIARSHPIWEEIHLTPVFGLKFCKKNSCMCAFGGPSISSAPFDLNRNQEKRADSG